MVTELVIEVDVGAAWSVEARQQLAYDDQQLQIGWLLDESPLDLLLVLPGGLVLLKHMLRVGVEFVSLIAVGWFARNGVVIRLVGRDDPAVLTERRVLEKTVVVTGVVDRRRYQDCGAAV